jgi:hypothetical protein
MILGRYGGTSSATPRIHFLVYCYAQSLVHSECLNDLVAGTVQIGIAGCHSWNPVLVIDMNVRL